MNSDQEYMQRCLQLAANGLGRVRPNPLVGCVIVKDGVIVSEGYHQEYGHNHAERNAILNSQSSVLNSTLYVNLEPCSHQGLTPPCADLIIEKGIRKVVCCNDDPNPLVAGKGFAKLEAAGIEVVRHILEDEGRKLNRRFFTFMEKRRPYIILKWAQTSDGFMAPEGRRNYWISSQRQNILNHRWRSEEAAILIGSQTYIDDKPQLTTRHYNGLNPTPIVLDRRCRLKDVPNHWLHLHSATLDEVMRQLFDLKIQSVIVEGGRTVLDSFISEGLYDEIRILRSPVTYGAGLQAPDISSLDKTRIQFFD